MAIYAIITYNFLKTHKNEYDTKIQQGIAHKKSYFRTEKFDKS